MKTVLWLGLLAVCASLLACSSSGSNGDSASSSTSSNGSQTWMLDFGPDPHVSGREELAEVTIAAFNTGGGQTSGSFNETSNSPGVYVYDPTGNCNYRLTIAGTVSHNSPNDNWTFKGVTGSGCGMSSTGSGGGSSVGNFPNATSAGGTMTLSTQSPLGTSVNSGSWKGYYD